MTGSFESGSLESGSFESGSFESGSSEPGSFKAGPGSADGVGMPNDPSTTTQRPTACPSCGAAVRGDVPWCTACYAALVPERTGSADPVSEASLDPAAAPATPSGTHPDGTPLTPVEVDALAARMLAQLAAGDGGAAGWLDRLPEAKGPRTLVITGVTVAAVLALVVLLTVVGVVL